MNVVREINKINERELELGGTASWHDEYKDSAYIFVGGLHFELTEGDVITIFSQYGEVMDVNMPRDKNTGKPRGFAFLMYEDQRSTILAVDNLNGAKVLERTLRVDHVKNYKQAKIKDENGEMIEPDEQSFNARPETIIDDEPESESSSDDSGPEIDPEDPMAEFLIAQRKEEKALKKSKGKKDKKKSKKDKHNDETPEERRARKERKKQKKAQKSAGIRGVEDLLKSLDARRESPPPPSPSRSRSRTPPYRNARSRSPASRRRDHSLDRTPPARRRNDSRSPSWRRDHQRANSDSRHNDSEPRSSHRPRDKYNDDDHEERNKAHRSRRDYDRIY